METVFKVGMEVYDQVNYPNKKGKVVDVEPAVDDDNFPIEVEFEGEYSSSCYTLDGRLDLEQIPTLSTTPYEIKLEGFEQESPAPTYERIRAEALKKGEYVSILNGIELPDDKTAKAFEALAKLIWLRDYYNDGWIPNFMDGYWNPYIIHKDIVEKGETSREVRVLTFKTEEIRQKFKREQMDLLKIAVPLL